MTFFLALFWRARAFAHSMPFSFLKISLCRENICVNIGQLYVFIRKMIIGEHVLELCIKLLKMESLIFVKPVS